MSLLNAKLSRPQLKVTFEMVKRDFIAEILDRRSRSKQWPSMTSLLIRLQRIEDEFQRRHALTDEMLRYFPLAIVACMEGYFRELIRELLDFGAPYALRLHSLDVARVDIHALQAIHGRTITVGEFVSHLVPLNNFDDINRAMSSLLDDDFAARLKETKERWQLRNEDDETPPIRGRRSSRVFRCQRSI